MLYGLEGAGGTELSPLENVENLRVEGGADVLLQREVLVVLVLEASLGGHEAGPHGDPFST